MGNYNTYFGIYRERELITVFLASPTSQLKKLNQSKKDSEKRMDRQ